MVRHDRSQGTFLIAASLLGVCMMLTGCSLFGGSNSSGSNNNKASTSGDISTYAGSAVGGYSGDGGQATAAELSSYLGGLAMDAAGNLFIVDNGNNVIRKVSASGIISTVAGNGKAGFSGDGGPATSAELLGPTDVALDSSGNLYIADYLRVRKVTPAGIISTFAGNGSQTVATGDGGAALSASLISPLSVAVDASGNVYISDSGHNTVRKVNTAGIINRYAGDGSVYGGFSGDGGQATSAKLLDPYEIRLDPHGNLYIAEFGNSRLRMVTAAGVISTIAGNGSGLTQTSSGVTGAGGLATSAGVGSLYGVALDSSGNIYITPFYNNFVFKIDTKGVFSTFAGDGGGSGPLGDGGPATSATLSGPRGVVADASGNIYIADPGNYRIRKVNH